MREDQKISHLQHIPEHPRRIIGQPIFVGFILLFVTFRILANLVLAALDEWGMTVQWLLVWRLRDTAHNPPSMTG